ncbi:MAG TPA: DUF4450 domain-containing protein [Opitutaceae bacterium]|nr:DUF4450 domain-containing protein [Opitutaceae bacterium]
MKTGCRIFFLVALFACGAGEAGAQALGAARVTPNLESNIDRPLRYQPDGADFVIENGPEFFNRPLYGGNTAFRVDGGDKPEFVLYLPGRGGNVRFGLRAAAGAKWLHEAAQVVARYRPGELLYEIRDPLLGERGVLRLAAVAYFQTEGLAVRAEAENVAGGVELIWAYGGVNGQRGARDGDIGTERVPISQYFQLQPEFCRENSVTVDAGKFTLKAKPATIVGVMSPGVRVAIGDAEKWNDAAALSESGTDVAARAGTGAESRAGTPVSLPVVVGRVALANDTPLFLSLQRVASDSAAPAEDLATYREVGAPPVAAKVTYLPVFAAGELQAQFEAAEKHFAELRGRVSVDTPDAFLNAAVGALNVAADAVWDEPQQDIMHGAIAWRTRLLGWRGPYSLDALGWHERARKHFEYWAGRQNTSPIPEKIPPASEKDNLARNEAGLHTNGDMSNSHYDMNLVAIDALFRHLMWTGDLEFARKMWPTIERHLAWERRLFRREFDAGHGEKLPLYEAYAAIWASDDLQYSGGGAMHATAYNYFHNVQAARLARLLKRDASLYEHEAQLIERAMRTLLWVNGDAKSGAVAGSGWFAETKDWLGLQRVHPSAAAWTFYHTLDSEVPTPQEAWLMTRQVDTQIPHLPVRGPGVPAGLVTLATSNWMPYDWSINNVVMGEAVHTALGFWQAGRADEAWRIAKGSLVAAMFMGISPGNVGSMSYLDVYRRESQRDFGDGSGALSRALVEGLFGVRPDALGGELRFEPGWPAEWDHAALRHPDFAVSFRRAGDADSYTVEEAWAKPLSLRLRLVARRDRVAGVTLDGAPVEWHAVESAVGAPRIDVLAPAATRHEIVVRWAGAAPDQKIAVGERVTFARVAQGEMKWWAVSEPDAVELWPFKVDTHETFAFEPVDLAANFNDRVTQIFKNEYRAPRSPFVSLALPKQGLGGWAGGVNTTAEIDDAGLRAAAAQNGGRIVLPDGVTFATPGANGAKNVIFTSQWENYPREATVPVTGRAKRIYLLMAGSTNPMQSRIDNGEVIATYADGTTSRLALTNPATWWPIEQDYFTDDFQFRDRAVLPTRVDLKTGRVRVLDRDTFKGKGGHVPGGAATVLSLDLDPTRELKSLTVRALANDVVIGLMAATLAR